MVQTSEESTRKGDIETFLSSFDVVDTNGLFGKTVEEFRSAANLKREAMRWNRMLPRPVDEATEMTSTTGFEGVFEQTYRLVHVDGPKVEIKDFLDRGKSVVIKYVCATPQLKNRFLAHGVTLRYSYTDMFGGPITSFDVHLSDCS